MTELGAVFILPIVLALLTSTIAPSILLWMAIKCTNFEGFKGFCTKSWKFVTIRSKNMAQTEPKSITKNQEKNNKVIVLRTNLKDFEKTLLTESCHVFWPDLFMISLILLNTASKQTPQDQVQLG